MELIASNLESCAVFKLPAVDDDGVIFGLDPSTNVIESRSASSLPADESLSVLSLPGPPPRLELARKQLSNTKAEKRYEIEGLNRKKMRM